MRERKTPYDELPAIPSGMKPKVLLIGNGTNKSFVNVINTDDIIQDEWNRNYGSVLPSRQNDPNHPIWELPLPLQVVAATQDHVQGCMSKLADRFKSMNVTDEQKPFINTILDTGFDAILTTNYSLEFEKSTFGDYSAPSHYKTTNKWQERFGIYQCTELADKHKTLLWHIHGTALRKQSLVMGQLYYGKLVSEIIRRSESVLRNYNRHKGSPFSPKSWIDYFLLSDLYIFGFALDVSESDIWWLLSYKKDKFPNTETVFYGHDIEEKKQLLLDSYKVRTPFIQFNKAEEMPYIKFYERICDSLKKSRMVIVTINKL